MKLQSIETDPGDFVDLIKVNAHYAQLRAFDGLNDHRATITVNKKSARLLATQLLELANQLT